MNNIFPRLVQGKGGVDYSIHDLLPNSDPFTKEELKDIPVGVKSNNKSPETDGIPGKA